MNSAPLIGLLPLFAIFLLGAEGTFAQSECASAWRFANRLQLGWETDNNVEESLRHPDEARSLRFIFDSRGHRYGKLSSLNFSYHSGLQLYWQYASENKLVNEANGKATFKLFPSAEIGLHGGGRLKIFLGKEADYAWGHLTPMVQIALPKDITLQTGCRLEGLDYAQSDYYDYSGPLYYAQIGLPVARGLTLSPQVSLGRLHLNRQAYRPTQDRRSWLPSTEKQNDRLGLYSLRADWLVEGILLNLSYNFETYRSNSYGFDFDKHQFTFMFAKKLAGILFRGYGTIQKKSYLDALLPFWLLELDTEKEESNFAVLDLSRDFTSFLTLMLRIAWYKNESPWASFYYQKRLINLGTEMRF